MITYALIRGVFRSTTGVTDASPYNAIDEPEPGVRPPKSAEGESSPFNPIRLLNIYWWPFNLFLGRRGDGLLFAAILRLIEKLARSTTVYI